MLMDNMNSGAAMAAPSMAAKANKKQGTRILIASFVALLVGAAATAAVFVAINKASGDNKDDKVANCDSDKKEPIAITPEKDKDGNEIADKGIISDAKLINRLAYKTNRIVSGVASSERSIHGADTGGNIDALKQLSDERKVQIIFTKYFDDDYEMIDINQLPDDYADKQALKADGYTTVAVSRITDTIKSDYRDLFGSDFDNRPETIISDFLTQSCGATYNKKNDYYVHYVGCGGANSIAYNSYQYKYELDGDKAYVYLALARAEQDYSSYPNDTVYNDWSGNNDVSDGNSSYIGKDDYGKYAHYRAVFERASDGDFYYQTIEKVND